MTYLKWHFEHRCGHMHQYSEDKDSLGKCKVFSYCNNWTLCFCSTIMTFHWRAASVYGNVCRPCCCSSSDSKNQRKRRSVWAWVAPLFLYPSQNQNMKMTVFGVPVAPFLVSNTNQTGMPKEGVECKNKASVNDSSFSQITNTCECCICVLITPPQWG